MKFKSYEFIILSFGIILSILPSVDAWSMSINGGNKVWSGGAAMVYWYDAPSMINLDLATKNTDGTLTTYKRLESNFKTGSYTWVRIDGSTPLGVNYFLIPIDVNDPNNYIIYGPITLYDPFGNSNPTNTVQGTGKDVYVTGSPTSTNTHSSATDTESTKKTVEKVETSHGLTSGQIVGVAIGGFVALLFIVIAVLIIRRCMYLQAIKDIQNKYNKNSIPPKNDASPLVNMPPSNTQSLASTIQKPEKTHALNGKEDVFVPVIHSPSISNNNINVATESNLNLNSNVYPTQNQSYPPQEVYSNVPYPSYDAMPSPTHFNFNDNSMYPPNPTSPTIQRNLYPPNITSPTMQQSLYPPTQVPLGIQNDIYPPLNTEPFMLNIINNTQSSAVNNTTLYPPVDLANLNSQKEEHSSTPELIATAKPNTNNEKEDDFQKPHYETVIRHEKPHSK